MECSDIFESTVRISFIAAVMQERNNSARRTYQHMTGASARIPTLRTMFDSCMMRFGSDKETVERLHGSFLAHALQSSGRNRVLDALFNRNVFLFSSLG